MLDTMSNCSKTPSHTMYEEGDNKNILISPNHYKISLQVCSIFIIRLVLTILIDNTRQLISLIDLLKNVINTGATLVEDYIPYRGEIYKRLKLYYLSN
jgi:hypothetical protein